MTLFEETLRTISPVSKEKEGEVRAHLDNLTKPKGSLGRLEEFALRYCLIRGETMPGEVKKRIYTFAGDHGVTEEGVSAYPREVTPQMVLNMKSGGAGINVLARHVGAEVRVVDVGVDAEFEESGILLVRKVRRGSRNMTKGPALTVEEAVRAVEVGISLAREAKEEGITILGTGDMGIGNTTPSAALFSALLPASPEEVTGRGTGIDDGTLARKKEVVRRALEVNKKSVSEGPLEALAAVGGLEIAAITGLVLGGASVKIPVVIDGFISTAGALVAMRLAPEVRDYLFLSHLSAERGHALFCEREGISPILDLGMRLGEGTGAALAMSLIEAGVKIYREMATFDSAGVSRGEDGDVPVA
ncbi:MAG: nicotinate-nucleotide--dimethylbenzimidazole phosphoribosyltransferase [Deltaproteobacteria bacterium]|nr:MAG: nicotinate-nucleotide--dimethylbenzimidazole phosphoribosyltransferase [Deltaproteobacteria bacterium]